MIQCKVNGVERAFNGDPEMPLLWYLRRCRSALREMVRWHRDGWTCRSTSRTCAPRTDRRSRMCASAGCARWPISITPSPSSPSSTSSLPLRTVIASSIFWRSWAAPSARFRNRGHHERELWQITRPVSRGYRPPTARGRSGGELRLGAQKARAGSCAGLCGASEFSQLCGRGGRRRGRQSRAGADPARGPGGGCRPRDAPGARAGAV